MGIEKKGSRTHQELQWALWSGGQEEGAAPLAEKTLFWVGMWQEGRVPEGTLSLIHDTVLPRTVYFFSCITNRVQFSISRIMDVSMNIDQ